MSPGSGRLAGEAGLGETNWGTLMVALYRHEWVVYAKQPMGGPAQVPDYLARYTHKVAISNHRITGLEDGEVRFRVRDPRNPKAGRSTALPAPVCIERFLSHVLPAGFKRIRHYGLLANRHKAAKLARCRALFGLPAPVPAVLESVADFMSRVARLDSGRCRHCADGRLRVIASLAPPRPAWLSHLATGPPP